MPRRYDSVLFDLDDTLWHFDAGIPVDQFSAEQHSHEANGHHEPDHVALFRTTLANYEVESTTAHEHQLSFALRPDVAMIRPRLCDSALRSSECRWHSPRRRYQPLTRCRCAR
jgi:FMN phosphatase YigB (HAD superfamily)